jgi:hypothetical protein
MAGRKEKHGGTKGHVAGSPFCIVADNFNFNFSPLDGRPFLMRPYQKKYGGLRARGRKSLSLL